MTVVGFMGLGTMASAIIDGLKTAAPDIQRLGYDPYSDNAHVEDVSVDDLCRRSDCIVLGMKPKDIPAALASLPDAHPPLISMAAGIPLNQYPTAVPVCRVMPNLAVRIHAGVSALCFNEASDPTFKAFACRLFEPLGRTVTVSDEDHMHTITALSGSGPAFFYRIIQAFANAGVQAGLSESVALDLVTQTALGSAKLVQDHESVSMATLDAMVHAVCSPGGTTAAGIQTFDTENMAHQLQTVIQAAIDRSIELGHAS